MDLATLTAKGQVTIPKGVRDALGLKRGDLVSWELEGESVRLRVVSPLDLGYLRGVQAGLTEWGSDEDDVAFADL
jgi:AbrB family looped-hinge helix DNA binding protein